MDSCRFPNNCCELLYGVHPVSRKQSCSRCHRPKLLASPDHVLVDGLPGHSRWERTSGSRCSWHTVPIIEASLQLTWPLILQSSCVCHLRPHTSSVVRDQAVRSQLRPKSRKETFRPIETLWAHWGVSCRARATTKAEKDAELRSENNHGPDLQTMRMPIYQVPVQVPQLPPTRSPKALWEVRGSFLLVRSLVSQAMECEAQAPLHVRVSFAALEAKACKVGHVSDRWSE